MTLVEDAADVIVLTEFAMPRGSQVAGALRDHGWIHQLLPAIIVPAGSNAEQMLRRPRERAARRAQPAKGPNGVMLASRHPIEPVPGLPRTHHLVTARLIQHGLTVSGVYIPPARTADHPATARHAAVWEGLLMTASALHGVRHTILGDFNTPRPGIDTDAKTRAPGLTHLGTLASMGYRDPAHAKPEANGPTWFGPAGERARLDFALYSKGFAGRSSQERPTLRPVNPERYRHLSDHLPVILELPEEQKVA